VSHVTVGRDRARRVEINYDDGQVEWASFPDGGVVVMEPPPPGWVDSAAARESPAPLSPAPGHRGSSGGHGGDRGATPHRATHEEHEHSFKGVRFLRGQGKWQARITILGDEKDLGLFDTAELAARRWDAEAVQCVLNSRTPERHKIFLLRMILEILRDPLCAPACLHLTPLCYCVGCR